MTHEARGSLREYLRRHHEAILLGAILLVALALRLYQLEQDSFWIDEMGQIDAARRSVWAVPKAALAHHGSAPLDYLITHFAYYYIGRSEGILRLPAVVWGVLSVATMYFLGKRMFDKSTGFLAAAILSILPSHVYYSQELRPYSLAVLMMLLTTFAFYHAVERNTRGAWALYGAMLAVGMYSHYYVAVAGMLHGGYLVLMALAKRLPWKRLLPYVVAAGIAGALFLPWVLSDKFGWKAPFQWPGVSTLLAAPFVSPGTTYRFALSDPLTWFIALAWASAVAGVCLFILGRSARTDPLGLLTIVVLPGMASVLLLDYVAPYSFFTRQFLPYAPLLVLLGAGGALGVVRMAARRVARPEAQERIAIVAVALLIAVSAATLGGSVAEAYRYAKQDWSGVGRFLLQHANPDDAILVRIPYRVTMYAPELKAQVIGLRDKESILRAATTHPRVWIIADWSVGFAVIAPDAAQWLNTEKPLEIPGFPDLSLYLYSATLSRDDLKEGLKQW